MRPSRERGITRPAPFPSCLRSPCRCCLDALWHATRMSMCSSKVALVPKAIRFRYQTVASFIFDRILQGMTPRRSASMTAIGTAKRSQCWRPIRTCGSSSATSLYRLERVVLATQRDAAAPGSRCGASIQTTTNSPAWAREIGDHARVVPPAVPPGDRRVRACRQRRYQSRRQHHRPRVRALRRLEDDVAHPSSTCAMPQAGVVDRGHGGAGPCLWCRRSSRPERALKS